MFISHKYKFIFIKTRKTAGSSIEKIFLDNIKDNFYFGGMPPEKLQPILPDGFSNTVKEHSGYDVIKKMFPNEWKNYYKFTIERNPWDKTVSNFHFVQNWKPKKTKNGFEDFVLNPKNKFFLDDWSLYTHKNKICVDYVIEYNNLEEGFQKVCNTIGFPYNNQLANTRLKSSFRPKKKYIDYYNEETKNKVAKCYNKSIEYFGYTF